MLLVVCPTVITNNLQPTDHLTNSEESKDLCENDGVCRPLRAAGTADLAECLTRGGWNSTSDSLGVSDSVRNRLEVGLERCDRTA